MEKDRRFAWYIGMEQAIERLLGLDFVARARKELAVRDELLKRDIAGRFSRGNLAIQRRLFMTEKNMDDRRRRAATLQFK
jgi:hypothetical protein